MAPASRAPTTSPSPPGATSWWPRTGGGVNRLVGFTPNGERYVFAEHNLPVPFKEEEGLPDNFRSEVAGPTFSPDGQTLFFNVQAPGVTFAVWGAFPGASAARRRQMSFAAPPAHMAPYVSGELAEAAAFHRLRVPIL